MTVLITGARGRIGKTVIDRLHAAGLPVRAASTRPTELTVPAGVATVELALDRPETFAPALAEARQVFLYSNPEGIDDFVEAARAAGVEHVVLLSSSSVLVPDPETNPLAAQHLRVERALAASDLTATVLRPGAFDSNAFGWVHPISQGLPVQLAYPDAHLAPIHPEDIADIAVEALSGTALKGRTVTLTGGQSLTFREQLDVLSDVLERDITVEAIDAAEAERQMTRFMPAPVAASLLAVYADACAGPAAIADTTRTLLGTPERSFRQWVTENAAAFTAC
ncbi:SDR family oxidoreductase [Kitasatospora sp. NPDC092948]|uniref:SDR family oxidoreductase n=1 Tax=Kitasatospora sp. NPDC092948 TaxID=3364088 RepID=UPI00381030BD